MISPEMQEVMMASSNSVLLSGNNMENHPM